MENGNSKPRQVTAKRVSDFTDLETWKFARKLRSDLYRITQSFPQDERYGLSSQIKRAASSVTANLAEGYGRYSYQENLQFCRQSRGSLYELRDHLTTALDAGYISPDIHKELDAMAISAIKLVNGYMRSTQNLKTTESIKRKS